MPPRPNEPPWSAEQLRQLSGYVTAGLSIPVACKAAGVKWSALKHWLQQGKRGIEPYVALSEALTRAKATREAACLLVIVNASRHDWRAGAWLLERIERRRLHQDQDPHPSRHPRATVRLYPVPMPLGAEPDQTLVPRLPGRASATPCEDEV